MKLGLFYSTAGNNNGPGKVVSNLIKGLEKNNIDVRINAIGDINGCLQSWNVPLNLLPNTTVIGPNLCVLPSEMPNIWFKFKTTIVPSEWIKNKYETFDVLKTSNINIKIWPVGIDTDNFFPSDELKTNDVLLYVKNRNDEAKNVTEHLSNKGLTVKTVVYGTYTEDEFKKFVHKSKCVVLLTKTESQGIAYQEILSMNVPCYVLNKDTWDDINGYAFPATSVPYFDSSCGLVEKNLNNFDYFYENLKKYNPRNYILNTLNLKKQASNYLNILNGQN